MYTCRISPYLQTPKLESLFFLKFWALVLFDSHSFIGNYQFSLSSKSNPHSLKLVSSSCPHFVASHYLMSRLGQQPLESGRIRGSLRGECIELGGRGRSLGKVGT